MTENLINNVVSSVESAITSNDKIFKNIMTEKRVFAANRNGSPELLALLSHEFQHSEHPSTWGHIFKLKEEGVFAACILNLNIIFDSPNVLSLFDSFWYSVEEAGCWYPARGKASGIGFDFQEVGKIMCKLIESFDPCNLDKEYDTRIVSLYPFPNPFKERFSFDQWKKKGNKYA